jgi:hypothetical protein
MYLSVGKMTCMCILVFSYVHIIMQTVLKLRANGAVRLKISFLFEIPTYISQSQLRSSGWQLSQCASDLSCRKPGEREWMDWVKITQLFWNKYPKPIFILNWSL